MDDTSSALAAATLVAVLVMLLVGAGVYVWYAWALSRVFGMLGADRWKAWVPYLNEAELLVRGGVPGWNIVFYVVPVLQLYGIYLRATAIHRINAMFGRGTGMTVLGVLLPPVWATMLGLGGGGSRVTEHTRIRGVNAPMAPAAGSSAYVPAVPAVPSPAVAGGWSTEQPPPPPAPAAYSAPAVPRSFAPTAPVPLPSAQAVPAVPAASSAPAVPSVVVPPAPFWTPAQPTATATAATATAPPAPEAPSAPVGFAAAMGEPAPDSDAPSTAPAVSTAPVPPEPVVAPPPIPVPTVAAALPDPPVVLPDPPAAPSATATSSTPSIWAEPVAAGEESEPDPEPAPAPESADEDEDDDELASTVVVDRRPSIPWKLHVDGGPTFSLTGEQVVIGRKPSTTAPDVQRIAVQDSTRTLSKEHARLDLADGVWTVTDLHATNGVIVLAEDGAETLLEPGAASAIVAGFVLGKVAMRITDGTAS